MNCQYFNTLTLRATLPGGGDFLLVRSRRSVGRVSCVLVYTPFKKHATLISNQNIYKKSTRLSYVTAIARLSPGVAQARQSIYKF